jgi:hypothetical protein
MRGMTNMAHLLDITNGKRMRLEELALDGDLPVACVVADDHCIQLTPPCPGTWNLAFLFLNGEEQERFIFIGATDSDDEWLASDGRIFTSVEIADLPLQIAAQMVPLTPENLRRCDS